MKLYELPAHRSPRPRIFDLQPNGHEKGWVEFDHIDGMYSYCVAFDGDGEKLGLVHLPATLQLKRDEERDGWVLDTEVPDETA